jgi:hypothetical protein
LEINELARIPEQAPIEAFDYNPNIPGLDYLVFVADVSPRQFELLQKGEIAPPKGWSLTGAREIPWRE